jgi:hypothetical protein
MSARSAIPSFLFRLAIATTALGLAPAALRAQPEPPPKEISDKVSAELGKLRGFIDAKNFTEALQLIGNLIAQAPNPSYDLAVLSQVQAQILLVNSNYAAAVAPLETTLRLSEAYGFFGQRVQLDTLYTLSQLHYQLGAEAKKPADQIAHFAKAYDAISRWLALSPTPSVDAQLYAASILYGQATLDPAHIDLAKIKAAREAVEKSLYLDVNPKDQAYLLLLATLQQTGDLPGMADLLELLVARHPDSVTYWQQLASAYYGLAAAASSDQEIRRFNLRALLTLERAQANGLLKSPRENYAIVALYFNLQRFDQAIGLLQSGIKSGGIESSRRNWELLAASYQQTRDNAAAVATLKEATARFPAEPSFEFSLGQLLYTLNRVDEAYPHLAAASAKDNLERPGQSRLFTAYVAFELQQYDNASHWLDSAAECADTKPEELKRLRRAVSDKLRDRAVDPAQPAA